MGFLDNKAHNSKYNHKVFSNHSAGRVNSRNNNLSHLSKVGNFELLAKVQKFD